MPSCLLSELLISLEHELMLIAKHAALDQIEQDFRPSARQAHTSALPAR